MKSIGVSGAGGHLGSAVVKYLIERASGRGIVAISRAPGKIAADGVEARFGDYDNPSSLVQAYKGLERLLLIPGMDLRPGFRAAQLRSAIDAAVAVGVDHVVYVSAAGTHDAPASNLAADYFAAEQHLMRHAPRWTVLRMGYYAESFGQEAQMSLAHGAIVGLGENKVSFVSRDDLAAAAAGILIGDGHAGAIYTGSGPVSLTGAQRAAAVATAAGKPMAFVTLPEEVLRGQLAQGGLPAEVVDVVISIQQNFVRGDFDIVTGDIERLSGRAPRALEEVLSTVFAAPEGA
jgi:NAD(P)H dehydrogenase (quinone)